jgi:hypothetical protein
MRDPQKKALTRKSPKVQTIAPTVLPQSGMVVWHEGDLVKLEVAGKTLNMHYSTALKISQMLRVHGKQSKNISGDFARHWSTFAALSDAEENDKRNFR